MLTLSQQTNTQFGFIVSNKKRRFPAVDLLVKCLWPTLSLADQLKWLWVEESEQWQGWGWRSGRRQLAMPPPSAPLSNFLSEPRFQCHKNHAYKSNKLEFRFAWDIIVPSLPEKAPSWPSLWVCCHKFRILLKLTSITSPRWELWWHLCGWTTAEWLATQRYRLSTQRASFFRWVHEQNPILFCQKLYIHSSCQWIIQNVCRAYTSFHSTPSHRTSSKPGKRFSSPSSSSSSSACTSSLLR